MPASAPSVHRYATVLPDRGRAYPSRIRATGVLRFRRLPFWIIPCRTDTRMPGCLSSRCCRTGFPTAQANGLPAVMPPPSRFPLQKMFVTRFSAFCRSVFPCLFPGAAILPPPGIPCRFHDTDLPSSAIFRVTFAPLTSLLYAWNGCDTPYYPFPHFRVSFGPSFLSSFISTYLTRIILFWLIPCLFHDTLILSP